MKTTIMSIALTGALLTASVQADIAFNGFANIVGGVTTSSEDRLFGYDDNFDFKNDSLFALQATSDLGDGLGVTAQIIARGNDDWDPDFAWAYVSYDANDNWRFLAGRQRAPFYMYSDYLDVSFAYPWITPPNGVYDLPIDSFDGLGAIYTTALGEFDTTVHFIYGSNTDSASFFGETIDPTFDGLFGASFTFNREWLTLRAAYFVAESTLPLTDITQLSEG
jgi:hypothetical protein